MSSKSLETFQIVATLLHSLHISLNILIYASLNPPCMAELMVLINGCRSNNKKYQDKVLKPHRCPIKQVFQNIKSTNTCAAPTTWTVCSTNWQSGDEKRAIGLVDTDWTVFTIVGKSSLFLPETSCSLEKNTM